MHDHIITTITALSASLAPIRPQCYQFHKVLLTIWPDGEGYYDHNHVITKIGDKYYDVDGEYEGSLDKFYPLSTYADSQIKSLLAGQTSHFRDQVGRYFAAVPLEEHIDDDGIRSLITQYGFEWGDAKITRNISGRKEGWVILGLKSSKRDIQIYVTKTGKVRIHDESGAEWLPQPTKR